MKRARWGLPTLEIIWGVLTFCQSKVSNVGQLYALRFLVGVAEAPVFAGTHFILGIVSPNYPLCLSIMTHSQAHGTKNPSSSSEPELGSSATL
jgi:hypothetical protein